MDTGVDALDKMTTAVGQLKWVTAEMAAEMLTASTALAKASSGAHKGQRRAGFQQAGSGADQQGPGRPDRLAAGQG